MCATGMEELIKMKKFAILALASALALPASAAGVTISGYVDIGWQSIEGGRNFGGGGNSLGQAAGATNGANLAGNDGFQLNEVNVDLSSQLTNDISAFMSFDAIAGAGVAVDFAYIDFANPGPFDLNLRAGRIPSVFGIEQRMSESPQTKFINLSLLSPLTVGSIDGAAIYGTFSPINYALAVSNDDVAGAGNQIITAAGAQSLPLAPGNNNGSANAASANNNNNLAISGRLGIVPIEGLEVGISGSLSSYSAPGNQPTDVDRSLLGLDASYSWGAFSLKAEYVKGDEEQRGAADADFRGFYIEGMYDISSKYSVGVRYNDVKIEQASAAAQGIVNDYSTISLAGVYRIADNVHLKAEYDINEEDIVNRNTGIGNTSPEISNDAFAVSLVGVF